MIKLFKEVIHQLVFLYLFLKVKYPFLFASFYSSLISLQQKLEHEEYQIHLKYDKIIAKQMILFYEMHLQEFFLFGIKFHLFCKVESLYYMLDKNVFIKYIQFKQ